MKRVINWEHYKDNWADWSSFTLELLLETVVGVLLLVLIPYGFVACLLGYYPDIKKEQP
jgi:hypothetical protein